ncbi:tetratricopeptide repeat protein [Desulforhopalus singaporensis]|uniref:Tetratricopeptide repeat-containing protein n=1 Tax=Desulforhopalus singaporensis TaxID=91360 RepID=A0A1H0JAR7_9BACT|nr:hypothetical protein [Desulforhopalus singaporensis]SDO40589.1 hypothetical protein SAMN05660330_00208 [Desulforhopalus singaporensis]
MITLTKKIIVPIIVLAVGGCAVPQQRRVTPPVPAAGSGQQAAEDFFGDDDQGPYLIPGQASSPEIDRRPVVSMDFVEDRIEKYSGRLYRFSEIQQNSLRSEETASERNQRNKCVEQVEELLNGYSELRAKLLMAKNFSAPPSYSLGEIQRVREADIYYLEGLCPALLQGSGTPGEGPVTAAQGEKELDQLDSMVDQLSHDGRYQELVALLDNKPSPKVERLRTQSKLRYAEALVFLHREEEAVKIYRDTLEWMKDLDGPGADLSSSRKSLADLYMATGNFKEARTQFSKITQEYDRMTLVNEWSRQQLSILEPSMEGSEELVDFSRLLLDFLRFVPEQDGYKVVWQAEKYLAGYPYSPVAPNVDLIKETAQRKTDRWYSERMQKVDDLAREQMFQQAIALLEAMPVGALGEERRIEVQAKKDELLASNAASIEQLNVARVQEMEKQWDKAVSLAGSGQYDEAIAAFQKLAATDYAPKAAEQIEFVSLEAAKNKRKEAAKLFIESSQETDPEAKKELLIKSRNLLQEILMKYPGVEIARKVEGNIKRVEQEMNAIDPRLIMEADLRQKEYSSEKIDAIFDMGVNADMADSPIIEKNLDQGLELE